MSDNTYIHDDFGNRIPLLDNYGNLSVDVIMLYSEDKLTAADRKEVDDFAATDEMSRDALEGYALTGSPSKTRYHLGQVNAGIQKISGAKAISTLSPPRNEFDYRKLAAAITLLIVVLGGTYFISDYFEKTELADNTTTTSEKSDKSREPILGVQPAPGSDSLSAEVLQEEVPPVSVMTEAVADEKNNSQEELDTDKKPAEAVTLDIDQVDDLLAADEVAEIEREIPSSGQGNVMAQPVMAAVEEESEIETKEIAKNEKEDAELNRQQIEELALASEASRKVAEQEQLEDARIVSEASAQGIVSQEKAEYADVALMEVEQQRTVSKAKRSSELERMEEIEETAAQFPGGDIELYKFLENSKGKSVDIKGTVTVSFKIEKDGRVTNAKVKTGGSDLANQDALRIVKSMPNWEPAKSGDRPNRSSRTVVIKYGNE